MSGTSDTDVGSVRIRFTLNTTKTRHMQAYEYLMSNSNRRGNMLADAVLLYAAIKEIYPNKKDYDRFVSALETYREFVQSGRQSLTSAISIDKPFVDNEIRIPAAKMTLNGEAAGIVPPPSPSPATSPIHTGAKYEERTGSDADPIHRKEETTAESAQPIPAASTRKFKEISSNQDSLEEDPLFSGLMAQMRRNGMDYDPRTAQLLQEDLQDFEVEDDI